MAHHILGETVYMFTTFVSLAMIFMSCNIPNVNSSIHVQMYRRVNAAEHLTTGYMPSYTLTAISEVHCVFKFMLIHCYKLSWNDHGKICKGYDNSGLVNGISQGVIFYAKEPGNGYTFNKDQNTWFKLHSIPCLAPYAISSCANESARLIYIDSLSRQEFVKTLLKEETGFFMIDGDDHDYDRVWHHTDGTQMEYLNFTDGEPSNGPGQIYIAVSMEDNADWHDIFYHTLPVKGYICEIPV